MKTKSTLACLVASVALLSPQRSEGAGASLSFFYDSLEPYGEWVDVADYGYCWHPRDADASWRPYTAGSWAHTDAGWTWISEEPYGWAVYHYGRWADVADVGWVWVPGTEWGPGWVSWRNNDRYVGWAPLPPESRLTASVTIGNWADSYFDIGPSHYSFVEVTNFGSPRLRSMILPPRDNITFISNTTNITNITYNNNVVINNGPDFDVISRRSTQPIRRLKLQRQENIAEIRKSGDNRLQARVEGDALVMPAPAIENRREAPPKQIARKIEKGQINRGWKDAGDAKQVETVRAKMKSEAQAPADLPPRATADATTGAPGKTDAPESNRPPQPTAAVPEAKGEADKPAKGQKPTVAAEPMKPGRERPDRAPKPNQPDALPPVAEKVPSTPAPPRKPDAEAPRPERTGRPDRPGRETDVPTPARPERTDRPEPPQRPERPNRPEGQGGPGLRNVEPELPRGERPGQPNLPERPEPRKQVEPPKAPDAAPAPNRPPQPDAGRKTRPTEEEESAARKKAKE